MKKIRLFIKQLLCHHEFEWDMTRPLMQRWSWMFNFEETITPVQCPKCGKKDLESNIL